MKTQFRFLGAFVAALLCLSPVLFSEKQEVIWSDQERPIYQQIRDIRKVPDDARGQLTITLAVEIRQLPAAPNKLRLALGLANRATEGDFGHAAIQEVAITLADAIKEQRPAGQDPYIELASLVRYEHVDAFLDSPQLSAAMSKLETDDHNRQAAILRWLD